LNVLDGAPAWDFQNRVGLEGGDGLEIGIISGGASIDYAANRAYFASRQDVAQSQNTLWCISFTGVTLGDDGTPASVGAPSLDLLNSVIYVGTDGGIIYAVDFPLP
jgi:hypothetical protein